MRFSYFIVTVSLILSVGCAREIAVEQPTNQLVSPSTGVSAFASTAASDTPIALRSGSFVAGEAPTEGIARIIDENGNYYLELDQSFQTSDRGPDLFVILHRADDVLGSTEPPAYPLQEQDYIILGALQQFSGAQRYPIPEEVNLEDYKSAVIWCRQFNATFGVATFDN